MSKFNQTDHDQIGAMFAGLQLGHSSHRIDNTMRDIEDRAFRPKQFASNKLRWLTKKATPDVRINLREAGIL